MRNVSRWILPVVLLVSLVLAGGARVSFAQAIGSGDIRGTVTDGTGAVVTGATVSVLNVDTGVSKDYTTNSVGLYDTASIVPGHYKLTFGKQGFETLIRGPITVDVGLSAVDVQLKVGQVSTQITVNTDVALLNTESGDQTAT